MISPIGSIRAFRKCPFIYFLVLEPYLYIGETQDIPLVRWGDHLRSEGSFTQRLRVVDEDILLSNRSILAFGYCCDKIFEGVPIQQRRNVTQYIEHQVHIRMACHAVLGPRFTIISDTTRTAVASCRFGWADDLADELTAAFARNMEAY